MSTRPHDPPQPMLFGYDPERDLPSDHLARLVEAVVESANLPRRSNAGRGQPSFDPRLCAKVLMYGYATGVRSSRQLERLCSESLPYLYLTRGDTPSYRTLCSFRVNNSEAIEKIFVELFEVAGECGMRRLGRVVIDSSRFRADASRDSIVNARDYDAVLAELKQILKEASEADAKDDEDPPGQTRTGHPMETEQMRDILRRVRSKIAKARKKDADIASAAEPIGSKKKRLSRRMRARIKAAIEALVNAQQDGRGQACLTDPDARMMGEGRDKHIRECYSFEVVVDGADGLLVVGQTSQSNVDNPRLGPLVGAAETREPNGIVSVDADSGFYSGESVGELLGKGIDTCIPDSNTACDMHRGLPIGTTQSKSVGSIVLEYDAESDLYRCPEGNVLLPGKPHRDGAQMVTGYRAQRLCTDCPLASSCLTQRNAKYRYVKRVANADILEKARQRFKDPDHQRRYYHRADTVETVFAFIRSTLGFTRWSLRSSKRVASEGALFKVAYQLRKVHVRWAPQPA